MAQQFQGLLMQQMALSNQMGNGDQMINPMAAFQGMGMGQPGQADAQNFGMMGPGFMPMMFPGGNNQMGGFNPFMMNQAQPNSKDGEGQ